MDNYRLSTGLLNLLDGRLSGEACQREEACVASATPEPLLDSRLSCMKKSIYN